MDFLPPSEREQDPEDLSTDLRKQLPALLRTWNGENFLIVDTRVLEAIIALHTVLADEGAFIREMRSIIRHAFIDLSAEAAIMSDDVEPQTDRILAILLRHCDCYRAQGGDNIEPITLLPRNLLADLFGIPAGIDPLRN